MTEAQWLAIENPTFMLEHIRQQVSDRKLRLFGCACCRRVWHLYDTAGRHAVGVAERLADQLATNTERRAAVLAISERVGYAGPATVAGVKAYEAGVRTAECTASDNAHELLGPLPQPSNDAAVEQYRRISERLTALERAANVPALRDIFGNPFRPVTFAPDWRTDTAMTLARQMYESRDFSAMPILADALQDAGCTNDDILSHCRDTNQTHVRGCWVVDLVLGKS